MADLSLRHIYKIYSGDVTAVKDFNLEIEDKEFIVFVGPSGCGKSTTLRMIAGLEEISKGELYIGGKLVNDVEPKERDIAMVFQNYALYPHMTVLENVMFPLTVGNKKMPKKEAEEIARKYMKVTSIEELANKKPGEMSGGQQQRVAITRALVQNPKILLLDEPLSNLDARLRLKIREEIRRLVKEIGITTVFVTHDQEEALSISDRIVLMNEGIVQQFDVPQNLYLEPSNLFVAKFMGNPIINIFEMEKEGNALKAKDFTIDLSLLNKDRFKGELNESKYFVGIRPEYFELSENPLFKAKVESIELIGKDCIVNFNANGIHAKSITDITRNVSEGDELGFEIDYNSIYIFQENGVRVY